MSYRILSVVTLLVAVLPGPGEANENGRYLGAHAIAELAGAGPLAFLPSSGAAPFVVWEARLDLKPREWRGLPSKSVHPAPVFAEAKPFLGPGGLNYPEHLSSFALLRAGRRSFHTTTPPPF